MNEKRAQNVMDCLKKMSFEFAKVKCASPIGTFTSLHDTIKYSGNYLDQIAVLDLFNITKDILMGKTESKNKALAVDRLVSTLDNEIGRKSLHEGLKEKLESDQFWFISSHLLLPLAGECTLSSEYRETHKKYSNGGASKDPLPFVGQTGIGSTDTWHGKPDAICNIIVSQPNGKANEDGGKETPHGGTETPAEAKAREFTLKTLNQVVGQAVVASFIQHNTYPRMNPLVPAIGISGCGSMTATMYDSEHDVLLHFHQAKNVHANT